MLVPSYLHDGLGRVHLHGDLPAMRFRVEGVGVRAAEFGVVAAGERAVVVPVSFAAFPEGEDLGRGAGSGGGWRR